MYVEDVNDERPVFTQQQYNRLGLRETAGIGTSVIVVRATDPDTGAYSALGMLFFFFLHYTVCIHPIKSSSYLNDALLHNFILFYTCYTVRVVFYFSYHSCFMYSRVATVISRLE